MEAVIQSRAFLNDAKRIIIKVGTSVVTENDGRLAPERLGVLCAQIQALYSQGLEVILVSSGAIGVGRQHLSTRTPVNSSSADLQKPHAEIDRKACAAVGQISIMSLYNKLFSKLDLRSAQLLVSHNDFRSPESRKQLTDTVTSLLSLKVIPIFNDNDAISTIAPYESFGIHWDNDSLAALLALELKADLLMFLSDVDGLYSGPPSDPQSKIIYTYIEEKHGNTITFGDKSSLGTGGMTTKVNAAVYASQGGIPVVITRFAEDNIARVLQGQPIGTLVHRAANTGVSNGELNAREESSRRLQTFSLKARMGLSYEPEATETMIIHENEADVPIEKMVVTRHL